MLPFNQQNNSAEQYWSQTAFSYKFFCLTSTVLLIFGILIPTMMVLFIDIPQFTIWSFQIWRILISMFGQVPSLMSLISILFSFMWLHQILKDNEASTIYKIIQIFLINLQIHLVFILICFLFTIIISDTESSLIFFGYGWFPIIIVYEFRNAIINPQGQRRFCCLPFLIKNKYYPWAILILLCLFSTQVFCIIASGIVGYYQQMIRKEMFIKLPYGFYRKLQSCLPDSVKKRNDFVFIYNVEASLRSKCWKSSNESESRQERIENQNPFSGTNSNQQPQKFQPFSQSSAPKIGGSSQTADYRNFWANKDELKQNKNSDEKIGRDNKTNQNEIQIQPNLNYNYNGQQNNSYAAFSQNVQTNKGLLQEDQKQYNVIKGIKNKNKDNNRQQDGNQDLI